MGAMASPLRGPTATSSSSSTPRSRRRPATSPRRRSRSWPGDLMAPVGRSSCTTSRPATAAVRRRRTVAVAHRAGTRCASTREADAEVGGRPRASPTIAASARPGRQPRRRRHRCCAPSTWSPATACRCSASTSGQLGYLTEVEPDRWQEAPRVRAVRSRRRAHCIEERMLRGGGTRPAPGDAPRAARRRPPGPQRGGAREDPDRAHGPPRGGARRRVLHHLRRRRPDRGHAHRLHRLLAVGPGPIVAPTHRALVLTPVSPHMLFDRTLVLEPGTEVAARGAGRPAGRPSRSTAAAWASSASGDAIDRHRGRPRRPGSSPSATATSTGS